MDLDDTADEFTDLAVYIYRAQRSEWRCHSYQTLLALQI